MNKIVIVRFHGADLLGFKSDSGIALIAVKPIATAMGLDWPSQYKRIQRDPILSEGIVMMTIPYGPGGPQEMVCLEIELLHGWLFKLDSTRIQDEVIRNNIQVFQRECYRVLAKHFLGDRDQVAREANETMSLHLRLCQECRHIHGSRAADGLWKKLGLPRVPEMDDAFRDLFNWRDTPSPSSTALPPPREQSPSVAPA